MRDSTLVTETGRASESARSELNEVVRQGAQRMPQAALAAEAEEYVQHCRGPTEEEGKRLVVSL